MNNQTPETIRNLEQQLQEKNQIIIKLQLYAQYSQIVPVLLHEEYNMLAGLSLLLTNHFEECRKKGATRYIDEIIDRFDRFQDLFRKSSQHFSGRKDMISLGECIKTCTQMFDKLARVSDIRTILNISKDASLVNIPRTLTHGFSKVMKKG